MVKLSKASAELLDALCDLLNACEATFDNRHERQAAKDLIEKYEA